MDRCDFDQPARTPHPAGPRAGVVVLEIPPYGDQATWRRNACATTFNIRRREREPAWTSIAVVTFVGVIACLFAMAAAITFNDAPRDERPARLTRTAAR